MFYISGWNLEVLADSSSTFSHVFGLAVFGDFLLYSDWDTNSINMIDMDTDFRTSLVSNLTRPTAIALYHPDDLSGRYTICFYHLTLCMLGNFSCFNCRLLKR